MRPCIAIDFDGTWTVRPRLLRAFALDAMANGDVVVAASGREDTKENRHAIWAEVPIGSVVVCCGGRQKSDVLRERGFEPVFFIDNQPHSDQRPKPGWWERAKGVLLTIMGAHDGDESPAER